LFWFYLVSNLDGKRSSFNFLVVEFESFLLIFCILEVDESESFASSVSSDCNVCVLDFVSSEDISKTLVVNGEREIGNIDHGRRRFTFFVSVVIVVGRISSSWSAVVAG